jgi:DnaJ-class molecular chaperone
MTTRDKTSSENSLGGIPDDGPRDQEKMTPHCCPVCGGRGWVQPGFYSPWGVMGSNIPPNETCRSCGGSGVLWR